jgi:hypothetical protein
VSSPAEVELAAELLSALARKGARILSFGGSMRVFLAVEPCDIRKGFEGLHGSYASVCWRMPGAERNGASAPCIPASA